MSNNNHKANQSNSKKGTKENNSANSKVNENKGAQMNPTNKGTRSKSYFSILKDRKVVN